ncbi:MAG: Hypothetical protein BHV28_16520 [Candidatus Tokpelaia hoelldobleri]|uniref:Uncharacterized protein n=1 Tax=Candidatus Tokpelaia hoelldobleri TaxID=1902579 RepID=A0A1U9JWU4_9HYPH|nr:MAG: Hypothetical protein BHV28_16520 [Candidatus Tokpelaia hoelldoblerii]
MPPTHLAQEKKRAFPIAREQHSFAMMVPSVHRVKIARAIMMVVHALTPVRHLQLKWLLRLPMIVSAVQANIVLARVADIIVIQTMATKVI